MADEVRRCAWASGSSEAGRRYHDEEWGVPEHDERALFELLSLEGAQAGLSWETVLQKRQGYRSAFAGFEVASVARYGEEHIVRLLEDGAIIRNRAKIESVVQNARAVLRLAAEGTGLSELLWSFVGGEALQPARRSGGEVPAETRESAEMARFMRRRGFRFVGPVTCYSLMQAAGLVNDHTTDCYRFAELAGPPGG